MNRKRISAAALALVMALSLVPAALADELPQGWTPAAGARLPQSDRYQTEITINGELLESYEYTRDIPDSWETETITVMLNEIPAVPTGYVPMRAIAQADGGSASWFREDNQSFFYMGGVRIITNFEDMSIEVDGETVEGATALLVSGVTYLPVSVIDGLEGFSVTDNSADGVESYEIATPNGTPIMKLARKLMETAGMPMGNQTSMEDMELFYGEEMGFQADFVTEGVCFMGMMTVPDTLMLGKVAQGKTEELKAALEVYRKSKEETFSWYLSHNLPKVQNAQFVTEGEWFIFLIAENAEEAVEVFRAAVAEME